MERRSKGKPGLPLVDLVSITQGMLIAECLSFRRKARMIGTQQSAVSRRVRALEDILGVSLFQRHRDGVRVTAAAHVFSNKRAMFFSSSTSLSRPPAPRGAAPSDV
jgi:hypothetical protein